MSLLNFCFLEVLLYYLDIYRYRDVLIVVFSTIFGYLFINIPEASDSFAFLRFLNHYRNSIPPKPLIRSIKSTAEAEEIFHNFNTVKEVIQGGAAVMTKPLISYRRIDS